MSVVFEPERPARSSRRPVAVGIVVAGLLLGAAVVKPWSSPSTGPGPSVAPSGAAVAARDGATPPVPVGSPSAAPALRPPPWVDPRFPRAGRVSRVLAPHDTWGVRLIVDDGPADGLREMWAAAPSPLPVPLPTLGERSAGSLVFEVGDRSVPLLGVTTPPGIAAPDVRVIVVRPLGRTAEVDLEEVPIGRGRDAPVLVGPLEGRSWMPGLYQVLMDVGGARTGITVGIFRTAPAADG